MIALTVRAAADGTTDTMACVVRIFSWTVAVRTFQSLEPLAMSLKYVKILIPQ